MQPSFFLFGLLTLWLNFHTHWVLMGYFLALAVCLHQHLRFGTLAPGGLSHILPKLISLFVFLTDPRTKDYILQYYDAPGGAVQAYESFDHPCVYCLS